MTSPYPMWDEWLADLSPGERTRALELSERFAGLGAEDAEDWARSELAEDLPQLARFLLLRQVWEQAINGFDRPGAIDAVPAAARLLDSGADRADLITLARRAALDAAFAVLYALDVPNLDVDDDSLPGWSVHETSGDGGRPGRHMDGLHEDLLIMDPSGRQAEDLLF
ncbi:hypothetical protein [Actinoallomurus soli]|uniref:hypothetical protein n=1 Tax=Actinoallomurus soli TaxID=2952535 RepID=UPI002092ADC9|nr:hypothetical protein [Actinoallomurus soli]MCO5967471.1 hypothetical protein [Actinoallomurus soli]